MTPDPRHTLGARGEAAAAKALRRAGYTIRDRNYTTRWGEIDIVAVLWPPTARKPEITIVPDAFRPPDGFA